MSTITQCASLRTRLFLLIVVLMFASSSVVLAAPLKKSGEVQIGLLFDIDNETRERFVTQLRQEVSSLLGNQYTISLPEEKRRTSGWSHDSVVENYRALLADPQIDIIVAVGALNSAVLAQHPSYPKPLILLGILDYFLQQIPLTTDKKSGVHNLTYILESREFGADLDSFYGIFPYQNLTVVTDKKLTALLPNLDKLLTAFIAQKGSQTKIITYDGDIDLLLNQFPADADAVFFGGLYALSDAEKQKLIDHVKQLKLPSYAFQGVIDVKRGVLSGSAPETDLQKLSRRIALNIEQILAGIDPAAMPTLLSFERRLTLNMQTAKQIDFSPTWETLASADLIDQDQSHSDHDLDFKTVVAQALQANLTLDIEQLAVTSAVENVAQARAVLLPSLNAAVSATRVDENSAAAFQAEETFGGSLTLDQLLYSEGAQANLAAQKHLLKSSQEKYREVLYDTILTAGLNYLNILQARSVERTNRNNLELVKKNYQVAEYRQRVGYAGAADVFRLKSEMATATSNRLAAQSTLSQAKIGLNEFLRRPLNQEFSLQDVDLAGDMLKRYGGDEIRAAVNTSKALEKLTQFLALEAMANMPELQQIRSNLAAQERFLLSNQRQRWLPILSLRGNVDEVLARDGVGSNLLPDNETSWNLNLNASWELYAGGAINSEVRQARAERNILRQQLLNAGRSVELALRYALLDLRVKSANLKLTKSAAEAAQENYRLVQDAYAQGTATITALLDAQNSALAAEQSAANSVYDYYASLLQVERAMGSFSITSSLEDQQAFLLRFQKFMDSR